MSTASEEWAKTIQAKIEWATKAETEADAKGDSFSATRAYGFREGLSWVKSLEHPYEQELKELREFAENRLGAESALMSHRTPMGYVVKNGITYPVQEGGFKAYLLQGETNV